VFVPDHFDRRPVSLLKLGDALFQAGDTRLEFDLVDDAFAIAVDQPADAALQGRDPSFQADDLIRLTGFITGDKEVAAAFLGRGFSTAERK
jgi:hypothetical protein